jgi:hypothetical protein
MPLSFALGPDRSIWILDVVKKRVAHYSAGGAYLGSMGGFSFDRFHAHPHDLAVDGSTPVVLEQQAQTLVGVVEVLHAEGASEETAIQAGSHPVVVSLLLPGSHHLTGFVSGRGIHLPRPPIPFPHGIFRLDVPGSGRVERLPGVPLGDGTFVDVEDQETKDFTLHFVNPTQRSVLPLRIEMVSGGRKIRAVIGLHVEAALEHGFLAWVMVAPNSAKAAQRFGGGQWLLRISNDGSPLLWERLPESRFDEFLVRKLTVGPDDSIYMMQVDRKGVSIFRR